MNEAALRLFRLEFRTLILERLVLRLAFEVPVILLDKSAQESQREVEEYIEKMQPLADEVLGGGLRDAALVGLYSEEARAVIDSLLASVRTLPGATDNSVGEG